MKDLFRPATAKVVSTTYVNRKRPRYHKRSNTFKADSHKQSYQGVDYRAAPAGFEPSNCWINVNTLPNSSIIMYIAYFSFDQNLKDIITFRHESFIDDDINFWMMRRKAIVRECNSHYECRKLLVRNKVFVYKAIYPDSTPPSCTTTDTRNITRSNMRNGDQRFGGKLNVDQCTTCKTSKIFLSWQFNAYLTINPTLSLQIEFCS
jgi:hypothetical protein